MIKFVKLFLTDLLLNFKLLIQIFYKEVSSFIKLCVWKFQQLFCLSRSFWNLSWVIVENCIEIWIELLKWIVCVHLLKQSLTIHLNVSLTNSFWFLNILSNEILEFILNSFIKFHHPSIKILAYSFLFQCFNRVVE